VFDGFDFWNIFNDYYTHKPTALNTILREQRYYFDYVARRVLLHIVRRCTCILYEYNSIYIHGKPDRPFCNDLIFSPEPMFNVLTELHFSTSVIFFLTVKREFLFWILCITRLQISSMSIESFNRLVTGYHIFTIIINHHYYINVGIRILSIHFCTRITAPNIDFT